MVYLNRASLLLSSAVFLYKQLGGVQEVLEVGGSLGNVRQSFSRLEYFSGSQGKEKG